MKKDRTKADERVIAGNKSRYLMTGLLVCGVCGDRMGIMTSGSHTYYRCVGNSKKGTCTNSRSIRLDKLEPKILEVIRERLMSDDGIMYVRKRVASELGSMSQRLERALDVERKRLAATEERIGHLIEFIANGQRSDYIASTLRDLEASAKAEHASIARLAQAVAQPIRLPSIDEVTAMVFDLDARLTEDPEAGRQVLRQWLEGQAITMTPRNDGRYTIKGGLLPLMVLGAARETPNKSKRAASGSGEDDSEDARTASNVQTGHLLAANCTQRLGLTLCNQ